MFRQPISWREFERLRQDMDRLLEETMPRFRRIRGGRFPAMNVYASDAEGVVVTVELPGIKPDALDIAVTADTLSISGKRLADDAGDGGTYHRRERVTGEFSRTFQLPYTINKDRVEASFNHGCLSITLPRAEAEKPKQIAVKAG